MQKILDFRFRYWNVIFFCCQGEFLQRLKKTADDGDRIFTEDVAALLHLADNDEEFSLAFEVIERFVIL